MLPQEEKPLFAIDDLYTAAGRTLMLSGGASFTAIAKQVCAAFAVVFQDASRPVFSKFLAKRESESSLWRA